MYRACFNLMAFASVYKGQSVRCGLHTANRADTAIANNAKDISLVTKSSLQVVR
eukprot:m.3652 g.3652  ORF g.3652 m.3652 type:complete len:54 (+) comp4267_c0_seq1:227-388(+)